MLGKVKKWDKCIDASLPLVKSECVLGLYEAFESRELIMLSWMRRLDHIFGIVILERVFRAPALKVIVSLVF